MEIDTDTSKSLNKSSSQFTDHSTTNSPINTKLPEMPQHQQAVDNLTSNSKSMQPSYASILQS
ncbi:15418_t:CDS:1, partial [Gigaspora rosea]